MKQSPRCYRFLQQIFILPSKSTLNKLVAKLNIEIGINSFVVEVMKKEVASLTYNKHKDSISGFVSLGGARKEFPDQALVFMFKGAIAKWQQAFAFYFTKGTVSSPDLKRLIKEVVAAAIDIGLHPVATICDQGSTFRKALVELQAETKRAQILAEQPLGSIYNLEIMSDESANISAKTRARALEPINKHGYMDGAAKGQNAAFQTSFNTGYEQGFSFGMQLAFNKALAQYKNEETGHQHLQDPRQINCQMCITGSGTQDNIGNLYNIQKEKNDLYFSHRQANKAT